MAGGFVPAFISDRKELGWKDPLKDVAGAFVRQLISDGKGFGWTAP